MSILKTLLFKQPPPLPAVVPPGRWGATFRNCCCQMPTARIGEKTKTGQVSKRSMILMAILDGCEDIAEIADRTDANPSTVGVHIKALEAEGKIRVNRSVVPYAVYPRLAADNRDSTGKFTKNETPNAGGNAT